nr:NlpC/P60 family protein [Micromonospora sp. DSM 115978]
MLARIPSRIGGAGRAGVRAGRQAVVRVAVATLWSRPEAVRPVDAPAIARRTDLARWSSGLHAEARFQERVLSQLFLGERVLVEEVRPDGWARLIALEQPAAKLDPRGYPGWLPAGQLAAAEERTAVQAEVRAEVPAGVPTEERARERTGGRRPRELVVDAVTTGLRTAPGGPLAVPGVMLGTRLTAAGPARRGWQPVWATGHRRPLWVPRGHVVDVPTAPPDAGQVLAIANLLRDVSYVWGGVSAYGIDCSGLVHLAWRRLGIRLPRDADDQAGATRPVPVGEERPGDLYLFARPGRPVHHIGIVTQARTRNGCRMLHASYPARRVLEEPVAADRMATLVGAHRVYRTSPG